MPEFTESSIANTDNVNTSENCLFWPRATVKSELFNTSGSSSFKVPALACSFTFSKSSWAFWFTTLSRARLWAFDLTSSNGKSFSSLYSFTLITMHESWVMFITFVFVWEVLFSSLKARLWTSSTPKGHATLVWPNTTFPEFKTLRFSFSAAISSESGFS